MNVSHLIFNRTLVSIAHHIGPRAYLVHFAKHQIIRLLERILSVGDGDAQ